jgi:hypothetical protein
VEAWDVTQPEVFPLQAYQAVLDAMQGKTTGNARLDSVLAVARDMHLEDVQSGNADQIEADMRAAVMSDDAARVYDLRDIEHARMLDRLDLWGVASRKS